MVKLPKLTLHSFSEAEMSKKEQNALRGGIYLSCACCTTCSCKYYGPKEGPNDSYYGGSSTVGNRRSNNQQIADSGTDD